ncbi:DUF89 family protein [bacterium]|nr:DUF89 family protein [bacterium]
MNIHLDCIPCIIQNYIRLVKTGSISKTQSEPVLRSLLSFLSEVDYDQPPPLLSQNLHRILRKELKSSDPYRSIKEDSNRMMLQKYPLLKKTVEAASNPFDTAMRLAIAGNVIDFGSKHQLDIDKTIQQILTSELEIDHSTDLRKDIADAKTLLYIGDNAGEIVLDKLFLETLDHDDVYFTVRGHPVINDATHEDAVTAGVDRHAKIITTGDDAPGIVWETTSPEFKDIFSKADVIISKGQGNLEGLTDIPGNIYFLLVTKCNLVSNTIGVKEESFLVLNRTKLNKKTEKENNA